MIVCSVLGLFLGRGIVIIFERVIDPGAFHLNGPTATSPLHIELGDDLSLLEFSFILGAVISEFFLEDSVFHVRGDEDEDHVGAFTHVHAELEALTNIPVSIEHPEALELVSELTELLG